MNSLEFHAPQNLCCIFPEEGKAVGDRMARGRQNNNVAPCTYLCMVVGT